MGDAAVPLVDVGGFDNVDSSATPEDYLRWMAHQRVWGADRAIARLELDSTSRVLDLGCGTGIDLRKMTELAGRCVGVDRSLGSLEELDAAGAFVFSAMALTVVAVVAPTA